MNYLNFNDQAFIAESFNMDEDFTFQSARLAFFKINSYKLSLINASFCFTRDELKNSICSSLLNYTSPDMVLLSTGFFDQEMDN
jgi:hypothetical protein